MDRVRGSLSSVMDPSASSLEYRPASPESIGTLLAGGDGEVVHASAAAANLLGVSPVDVVGSKLPELCSPDDRPSLVDWISQSDRRSARESIRFSMRRSPSGVADARAHRSAAEGETVVVEVGSHQLGPGLGNRASTSTLAEAVRLLERANRNIRSGTERSLDPAQSLDASVEAVRALVDGAAERPRGDGPIRSDTLLRLGELSAAIEGFVALSRAGVQTNLQLIPAEQLVADVLERARPDLEAVSAQVAPLPTGSLVVDRRQVSDALGRLIENAIRHRSPERGLRIEIRLESSFDSRFLIVADNGRGIPAEQREAISGIDTSALPGGGFGLAITRRVVESHGGRMRLEDGFDGGVAVRLEFPHFESTAELTDLRVNSSRIG